MCTYGFRNGNTLWWLYDRSRISFPISEGIDYTARVDYPRVFV